MIMISRFLVVLSLLASSFAVSADGDLSLQGDLVQGALILGQTQPGATVSLDGEPLAVTPDGRFVFGFSRDAGPSAALRVVLPGGKTIDRTMTIEKRGYQIERVDGLPPKTVTPPAEWLERRKMETGRVRKGRADMRDLLHWTTGFIKPAEGRYSGFYGSQRILNGQPRTPHYGLDIAAPENTPVNAPAAGVVTLADPDFLLEGGIVIIDHGYRVTSTLFHMNDVTVKEGDVVTQGQQIGLMGAKGRATGSHVDWRINWGNVRLDPALVLPEPDKP